MHEAMLSKADARFWAKVDKDHHPGGCWLWAGAKIKAGYGALTRGGKFTYAHRLSYELLNGEIPPGFTVDHICHVRECVNPEHIRLATYSQQNQNMARTNRSGYRGVTRNTCGRGRLINTWTAEVTHKGVRHRSIHQSAEAASEWAKALRLELFTHNDADRIR